MAGQHETRRILWVDGEPHEVLGAGEDAVLRAGRPRVRLYQPTDNEDEGRFVRLAAVRRGRLGGLLALRPIATGHA